MVHGGQWVSNFRGNRPAGTAHCGFIKKCLTKNTPIAQKGHTAPKLHHLASENSRYEEENEEEGEGRMESSTEMCKVELHFSHHLLPARHFQSSFGCFWFRKREVPKGDDVKGEVGLM